MDIYDNRFTVVGKAKERFYDVGMLYVIIANILFQLMPILLLFVHPLLESFWYKVFVAGWVGWIINTWRLHNDFNIYSPKTINIILFFPVGFPNFISMCIVINYLKRKYPNTEDPKEIMKFNRKRKLKSIL